MASSGYSFIDIVAIDDVRGCFAAGDAMVVLPVGLDELLWANGAGAALFGHPGIGDIMEAGAILTPAQRRQIAATPGYPAIGTGRGVALRLASTFGSRMAMLQASQIALPDGQPAILLSQPMAGGAGRADDEIARRAIEGFGGEGQFAALLDADGAVRAATPGLASLGISATTWADMIAAAGRQAGRVRKQMIDAGSRSLPMGLARIADEPPLYLAVIVDVDDFSAEIGTSESTHLVAIESVDADDRQPQALPDTTPEAGPAAPGADAADLPRDRDSTTPETSPADASASPPDAGAVHIDAPDSPPSAPPPPTPRDDWYFGDGEAPRIRQPAAPVRFVWRTDADGRFSAVSDEFASAVRMDPSEIVGKSFGELAAALGFDASGQISALLARRDTWSGRSVLWPIRGEGMRVPVDLAALPAYSRDRAFEGFRGFGVARMPDIVDDPASIEIAPTVAETPPPEAPAPDPFRGETPVIQFDPNPQRRQSDKIIRLAEHRNPQPDKTLSPVERNAFREIGDRLKAITEPKTETRHAPVGGDVSASTPDLWVDEGRPQDQVSETVTADAAAVAGEPASPEPSQAVSDVGAVETDPHASRVDGAPAETAPADQSPAAMLAETEAPDAAEQPDRPVEALAGEDLREELEGINDGEQDEPTERLGEDDRNSDALLILTRLPLPLLIHSGDTLHFANREFLSLTGYEDLAELESSGGLGALIAGPDEAGDGTVGRMLRIRTREGDEIAAEGHLQSVPWRGGKALLLALRTAEPIDPDAPPVPDARWISQRIDEMRRRVAEMQAIVDTATDGIVLISNAGAIRSISSPAEALFGFDAAAVAGKPFQTLFAVESHRAVRDYLAGLAENGVASVLNDGREVIGREVKGGFIPLFMTIGRLPDGSGYCAVLRDITQWKRAEEELTQARAQAERASSHKSDFLARISHEIRTPLNAIIGFSELIIDERFGPIGNERYRDYMRDINRSGSHVLDLVNDLLDISKIEAGEQEMAYEAVSLNETLAETVAMMQPQANRDRVIIRSSFSARLPEVVADLRSVRQIALNLLSNAVRYTQAGGQVIISTAYEPSGDVVMRVRDTGIGMTHAEIEQALKPFKQINALKRARGDGTGLGLPLTKAMVEANRAKFAINSTPGEGTMIEITFPSTRVLAG